MSEEDAPVRKMRAPLSATMLEPDVSEHVLLGMSVTRCRASKICLFLSVYLVLMLCLAFRNQLPPFLDCVEDGNLELVKEHLSREEQVGTNNMLCPSLLTSS